MDDRGDHDFSFLYAEVNQPSKFAVGDLATQFGVALDKRRDVVIDLQPRQFLEHLFIKPVT
jgi:hypothetical protein